MDLNSATPAGKRSRSKAKNTADTTSRNDKSQTRGSPETQPVIEVTSVTADVTLEGEVVSTMIATAAYYIAEQRNFEPGHELQDWLEAERQIRALQG